MPPTASPILVNRCWPFSARTSRISIVHLSATRPMISRTSASTFGSTSSGIAAFFAACGTSPRDIDTLLLVSIGLLGVYFPLESEQRTMLLDEPRRQYDPDHRRRLWHR